MVISILWGSFFLLKEFFDGRIKPYFSFMKSLISYNLKVRFSDLARAQFSKTFILDFARITFPPPHYHPQWFWEILWATDWTPCNSAFHHCQCQLISSSEQPGTKNDKIGWNRNYEHCLNSHLWSQTSFPEALLPCELPEKDEKLILHILAKIPHSHQNGSYSCQKKIW